MRKPRGFSSLHALHERKKDGRAIATVHKKKTNPFDGDTFISAQGQFEKREREQLVVGAWPWQLETGGLIGLELKSKRPRALIYLEHHTFCPAFLQLSIFYPLFSRHFQGKRKGQSVEHLSSCPSFVVGHWQTRSHLEVELLCKAQSVYNTHIIGKTLSTVTTGTVAGSPLGETDKGERSSKEEKGEITNNVIALA